MWLQNSISTTFFNKIKLPKVMVKNANKKQRIAKSV